MKSFKFERILFRVKNSSPNNNNNIVIQNLASSRDIRSIKIFFWTNFEEERKYFARCCHACITSTTFVTTLSPNRWKESRDGSSSFFPSLLFQSLRLHLSRYKPGANFVRNYARYNALVAEKGGGGALISSVPRFKARRTLLPCLPPTGI